MYMEPKEILIHRFVNAETGEITEKPYTQAELDDYYLIQEKYKPEIEKNKKIQDNNKSAIAKLAALGLTEDEIAAL